VNLTSLPDYLDAHRVIGRYLAPTPLAPAAPRLVGRCAQLFTKHENLTPIRSFKIRGALYRVSLLTEADRASGVVTFSTGNHGMGIAYAAREFGTSAVVVVPENASRLKIEGIERFGADIRAVGANLSEAQAAATEIAREEGRVLIVDGDDLGLMIGAGTISLEILEALPETEVLLVPIGGGNLIAGMASCAKLVNPRLAVIGIQSVAAPCVYESRKAGRVVHVPSRTFAGGLAADHPGDLAFSVATEFVDDIVLVTEEQLRRTMVLALTELGQVLEGAGAATLSALEILSERLEDKVVVALLSGGNAETDQLYEGLLELGSTSASAPRGTPAAPAISSAPPTSAGVDDHVP
jgi:threonine dehydratase